MSTTHPVDEVEAYVAEVRDRLSDLPDEERAELLDDVATHLREVADEHGATNLRARLGSPTAFGDDLRASAGYPPVGAGANAGLGGGRLRRISGLYDWVPTERIEAMWTRLEPAWWLVRGALVALLVLTVLAGTRDLVPRIGQSQVLGAMVLLAAGVASFALGERRPIEQRFAGLRVAAEVGLVLFGLFYVADASRTQYVYVDSGASVASRDGCLRDSAGRAIANLYGFDMTGQLIPQFFLTDQAGRPIDNLCPDQAESSSPFGPAQTTYARDRNGAPVYNVFPRAQHLPTGDPATGQIVGSEPVTPPAVLFPQVAPAKADTTTTTTTTAPSP